MPEAWNELERRVGELRDLGGVVGLLTWDQETFMPPGGAQPRAAQLSAMQAIIHERLTDPGLEEALAAARAAGPADELQAALLRCTSREQARAAKVPARLVRELAVAQAHAVEGWRAARTASSYALFEPHLARLMELRREQADALGHDGERYDAHLDVHEPGMRVSRLQPILLSLEAELIPIVELLCAAPAPAGRWEYAGRVFAPDAQWAFSLELLSALGFDLTRGRQDRSIHPFTDGIHPDDVRLTTRILPEQPFSSIYGTIHEGGHGLYEQGLPRDLARSYVGLAASMGLHESQSRLWENPIGRSLAFWERFLPRLALHFPEQLAGVSPQGLHAAVNRVERTTNRVESDEVTYNLHILLRFRLELALLRGDLSTKDLPGAWNDAMVRALGIRPRNDVEGVLQDIHWAWGELGYFPTYTLGNLYAASLRDSLDRELGGLDAVVRAGDFPRIREWLRVKVHSVGSRKDAEEIVRDATGVGLSTGPFLAYLRGKYGPLYGVKL